MSDQPNWRIGMTDFQVELVFNMEKHIREQTARITSLESQLAEMERNYQSAVAGRQQFRDAFRRERRAFNALYEQQGGTDLSAVLRNDELRARIATLESQLEELREIEDFAKRHDLDALISDAAENEALRAQLAERDAQVAHYLDKHNIFLCIARINELEAHVARLEQENARLKGCTCLPLPEPPNDDCPEHGDAQQEPTP